MSSPWSGSAFNFVGPCGEMVSNIAINITGRTDVIMLEWDGDTCGTDDYDRLSPTVTHLDGTTTSGSSGCCGSSRRGGKRLQKNNE